MQTCAEQSVLGLPGPVDNIINMHKEAVLMEDEAMLHVLLYICMMRQLLQQQEEMCGEDSVG